MLFGHCVASLKNGCCLFLHLKMLLVDENGAIIAIQDKKEMANHVSFLVELGQSRGFVKCSDVLKVSHHCVANMKLILMHVQ